MSAEHQTLTIIPKGATTDYRVRRVAGGLNDSLGADLRIFAFHHGDRRATQKGMFISVENLPHIISALQSALQLLEAEAIRTGRTKKVVPR